MSEVAAEQMLTAIVDSAKLSYLSSPWQNKAIIGTDNCQERTILNFMRSGDRQVSTKILRFTNKYELV
ncbi:hypothetical protein [Sphaerospermopsis aphanizomenoides]|uniref:hypothetical protein n=1 Tax=Sphaerospermopsis aphanizomenoides TaxID=459663 RepID=UPI0019084AF5|nr:hypothetical protein [Sphaerospermopsis aphanizomenoides]